jgi:nitrogen fixation NifU-like protein
MTDLADLYQEIIVDHSKRPRNNARPPAHSHMAEGHNPLCGDSINVYVTLQDGRVADVGFEGRGCAISIASASLMTEAVKGKTLAEARAMFRAFHSMVTGKEEGDGADDGALPEDESMDKLAALEGVRDFPVRVKCATLAWHTLQAAFERRTDAVSTE